MEKENIKAMKKKELCEQYGISYPTLRRWLKKLQEKYPAFEIADHRMLTPHEVRLMYTHFGKP